jgi:hypothetical protein
LQTSLHGPSALQLIMTLLPLQLLLPVQLTVQVCPAGQLTVMLPPQLSVLVHSTRQSKPGGQAMVVSVQAPLLLHDLRHVPGAGPAAHPVGHMSLDGGLDTPHAHAGLPVQRCPVVAQSSVPMGRDVHVPAVALQV